MAAVLPKVAQSVVVSGLRRVGNYSAKTSDKEGAKRPYKGAQGTAMFRFLGAVGTDSDSSVVVGDGGGPSPPRRSEGDGSDPLLLWQNVNLTYEGVPTLASVSGFVRTGEFVCVLGPGSGSDRLALLDVFSGAAKKRVLRWHFTSSVFAITRVRTRVRPTRP